VFEGRDPFVGLLKIGRQGLDGFQGGLITVEDVLVYACLQFGKRWGDEQAAAVLEPLEFQRSPKLEPAVIEALLDGEQVSSETDEVIPAIPSEDRPRRGGEQLLLLQYAREVRVVELTTEHLRRVDGRRVIPLLLSRFEDSPPLRGGYEVEVLAKEGAQLQRPVVKELIQGLFERARQLARQAGEDLFGDGKGRQIHLGINAEETEKVTQQGFRLAHDGFIKAHVQLLTREHGQPAPELAEVISVGKGPVVGKVVATLAVRHSLEVRSAAGETGLSVSEVVLGMRPGAGNRIAHQEDEFHLRQQATDQTNSADWEQRIGRRGLPLHAVNPGAELIQIPTEVEPLEEGAEIFALLECGDKELRMTAEVGGQPGGTGLGWSDDEEVRAQHRELVIRDLGLLQAPEQEVAIHRDGIPFHGFPSVDAIW